MRGIGAMEILRNAGGPFIKNTILICVLHVVLFCLVMFWFRGGMGKGQMTIFSLVYCFSPMMSLLLGHYLDVGIWAWTDSRIRRGLMVGSLVLISPVFWVIGAEFATLGSFSPGIKTVCLMMIGGWLLQIGIICKVWQNASLVND
jgi:hypothetical protein